MGELINLNKVKKAKARAEKDREADLNRAKHGRSKDEKTHAEADKDRLDHVLDGAKIEDDDPPGAA